MDEALARGIELFNQNRFFECHETLEELWKPSRAPRRLFLQGIIHLAVGFYHVERGNPPGAARQLRKGLRKLAAYLPVREGIDTGRLYRECAEILAVVEAGVRPDRFPRIHLRNPVQSN